MVNSEDKSSEDRLYEAHAEICRVLANPWRLRIVEALGRGEASVSSLAQALGVSMSNLSQHLALMRDKGVVEARRSGGFVHYRLTSEKTLAACQLMREVLVERLTLAGELSRTGMGSARPRARSGASSTAGRTRGTA